MKISAFHISVRYRYLFSFILIALIPIFIILICFYRYNISELKKDIDAININRVSQIEEGIDSEIMNQYSLATSLEENPRFQILADKNSIQQCYEALTILQQQMSYRNLSSATAVLFLEQDQAYTKTGISTCPIFFQEMMNLAPEQIKDFHEKLALQLAKNPVAYIPVQSKEKGDLLICAYSIPKYNQNPSVVLVSGIDQNSLTEHFSPILINFPGSAFIMDSKGQLLFQTSLSGENQEQKDETIEALSYTKSQDILPIMMDGQHYSVIYSHSSKTGLIYGIVAKEQTTTLQIAKQTTLIWQMALSALVICLVVIVALTLINYLPIKKILILLGINPSRYSDEYRMISDACTEKMNKSDRLEMLQEQQQPFIQELLLNYILFSDATTAQIHSLMTNIGVHFINDSFFVLSMKVIQHQSGSISDFKKCVIDVAELMHSTSCPFYTLERSDEEEFIVVGNCPSDEDYRADIEAFFQNIRTQTNNRYTFRMGMGTLKKDVSMLKDSFYEASMAILCIHDLLIADYRELITKPDQIFNVYPAKEILLFKLQLQQGDQTHALETLNQLCEIAQDASHSYLISRYLYSYVINAMVEVIQQVRFDHFDEEIHRLMMYKNAEDFTDLSVQLINRFCASMQQSKQNNNTVLRDQILTYVKEHISDVNLGLENIGEVFDLSPYYISRFFTDQNNINLKDFIANLRIAMAKDLLMHTDQSVTEIVQKIGYLSTSSFIRKFKAVEGITPTKFRDRFNCHERSTLPD